jgi:hypothetical protein
MAVTASTVNTTDTLETFRLQYNNLKSDVTSIDDTVSGGGSSVAADNINAGDAAVSITTTAGNITIDAQGSDTDIVFKGTMSYGDSDITALTLDMSLAGKAIFNGGATFADAVTIEDISLDGKVLTITGSPDDTFSITAGTNGATTIATVDTAGANGNLTVNIDGYIELNAGDANGSFFIKNSGTSYGTIFNSGNDFYIKSFISDGDLKIQGVDNNSAITALTFDMSAAGAASFNDDVTVGDDLFLASDSSRIFFGAGNDVLLTHIHDSGLRLTHGGSGNNLPVVFQLKSEEDFIIADDVIGSIEFAAGDNSGTDAATVAAGIHAIAEGEFTASANATKLVFTTGVSETAAASATAKMSLSSAGKLAVSAQISGDAINVPITLGGTDGFGSDAGDNIVQEAGSDENDRMLYEDALFDSVETVKSHGVTFPGQRIQVSGGASADIATLNDGALIESDFGSGTNFSVTLADNRTLQNPIGLVAGQSGSIFVTQDGTGSRTLAFGSFFHFAGGTAPTMTTTASAIDRIDYIVKSTSVIHAVVSLDVKATS